MNIIRRSIFSFAVFVVPLTSYAQVANGDFASGTASWSWSKSVFAGSIFGPTCSTTTYANFSPSTSADTPNSGSSPASGRVAKLNDYLPYGAGSWYVCRKIEQTVFVPLNKNLKFDIKLGAELTYTVPWSFGNMTVSIIAFDASTGSEITIYSETKKTSRCVVNSSCPVFLSRSVGVSQYGGKSIKLTVLGATSGSIDSFGQMTVEPTPAWIDNIRFE